MAESPEAYTLMALAVVWISQCFTLSLSRKFNLLFITYIYSSEQNVF